MAVIQVADAIANATLTNEESLPHCILESFEPLKMPLITNNLLLFNNQCFNSPLYYLGYHFLSVKTLHGLSSSSQGSINVNSRFYVWKCIDLIIPTCRTA